MPPRAQPSPFVLAARDIKLAHSVFALPFAILGAALAADLGAPPARLGLQFVLIVLCMVAARTFAMLVNRIADARFDTRNPRTAGRAIPSGQLPAPAAVRIAAVSAAGFILCTSLFYFLLSNPWPPLLSVPVLGVLALYSYTKRFTALCHIFLGAALALSPVAAALAIEPAALGHPAIWFIAAFVLLWVAGFDTIYALQDLDFDRDHGLRSIPAALGWKNAIRVSRVLHVAAFVAIAAAWHTEPRLGHVFLFGGLCPLAALLTAEHAVLAQRGKAGLEMAFFTLNGLASLVLGVAGLVDIVLSA